MIIFDENIDQWLIDHFAAKGYQFYSIKESYPGITDLEVIELVKLKKGLLVTEDKDFGEYVFAYSIKNLSVVFIRLQKMHTEALISLLSKVVDEFYKKPDSYFFKISSSGIRVRKI